MLDLHYFYQCTKKNVKTTGFVLNFFIQNTMKDVVLYIHLLTKKSLKTTTRNRKRFMLGNARLQSITVAIYICLMIAFSRIFAESGKVDEILSMVIIIPSFFDHTSCKSFSTL